MLMKVFKHVPKYPLPSITEEMTDQGRFYHTPEGNRYPSVTTVLGSVSDKSYLQEWKKNIGEEEAARILKYSGVRGTIIHQLAEDFLSNKQDYRSGHDYADLITFDYIHPFLQKNIGLIAGLEIPLYSDELRVAGRTDCVAKWDGVWSIIDFKTSRNEKREDQIESYFLQTACYAKMFEERIGLHIPQIVIVMTCDFAPAAVFVKKSTDYIEKFKALRQLCLL